MQKKKENDKSQRDYDKREERIKERIRGKREKKGVGEHEIRREREEKVRNKTESEGLRERLRNRKLL